MSQEQDSPITHVRVLYQMGCKRQDLFELDDGGGHILETWRTSDGRSFLVEEFYEDNGQLVGWEVWLRASDGNCSSATLDAVNRWLKEGR